MVAGSILPVTIHKNKLYFLFGKENRLENSAKGWSDFGGGVEHGETPFKTAVREGGEELTGFLGDGKDIQSLIKKNGGFYKVVYNEYHVHMFYIDYDENLPKYYNKNHQFLWERMDNQVLHKTKLFEKIEIDWFSIDEIKKSHSEFREFYREIIDHILSEVENIEGFLRICKDIIVKKTIKTQNHRKTYKKTK